MKNKIYIFLFLLLSASLWNSCSEDFLELKPIAAENEAAFYQTMAHADQAIIACYSQFNNVAAWDRDLMMYFGDVCSDDFEAGGDFVNEVPQAEQLSYLDWDPTDGVYDNVYGTLYRAINFCNIALEKLPSIEETDPDADVAQLNIRIAEAKFLRALNHFYLTIVFGEVPLVDHVLGPTEYKMGRAPLRDIYDLIEKDCKDAMAVLPERGSWNGEEGRATKGAAKALLARLYLYESSYAKYYGGSDPRFANLNERWGDALKYAEEVISSGKYKLVGIDGETYPTWRGPETNGFRYIFTSEGDYSPETVFEITCIQEGLGYEEARGHSLSNWSTARYYIDEGGVNRATSYWGLGLPHPDLKAAYDDGDARLRTTMAFEGSGDEWIEIKGGLRYPISYNNSVTKTYQRKWESSAAEFADVKKDWNTAPANIKLIRYADVYLIAAEAALMSGNSAKALEYVNKVRERARNCGTSGQPAALTSVSMEDIMHERRLEFAGEGHRFFDIVRWNKAYDLLNKPTYSDFGNRQFVRGENEFQPLPQREIDLSGGALQQYTAF
ncbi:MAG TPA: RagB/SusD family nutrient uptake outer membrane protein [Prolixibacteraceae bacterium]|nr:RagB/SusD family nutrient uptake outer membrane protein [Prolixibacteraceae bacterium]